MREMSHFLTPRPNRLMALGSDVCMMACHVAPSCVAGKEEPCTMVADLEQAGLAAIMSCSAQPYANAPSRIGEGAHWQKTPCGSSVGQNSTTSSSVS